MKQKKPPLFIPLFSFLTPGGFGLFLIKILLPPEVWSKGLLSTLIYILLCLSIPLFFPLLFAFFVGSCIDHSLSNVLNRLLGREHNDSNFPRPPNDPWSII